MADMYSDPTGSKKKFLVPIVVLVLCAVSLTGAGYAYNTTVENSGSIDNTGYQVIDLYTAKDTALSAPFVMTGIKIYTERVADTNTTTVKADNSALAMTPAAYVAVHKSTGTAATAPDADLTNAVAVTVATSTEGFSASNNVITANNIAGCTVTVTFTLGAAIADGDLAGYRAVQVAVAITDGTYTGGAHAAAKLIQEKLNGLDFVLTFASTVA